MTSRDITFPAAGGRPMRAAIAGGEDGAKRPGVIVIHEIFGLNDDIRRITARVAGLGYVALAPDLYDGPGLRAICIARTLMSLNRGTGQAFEDLESARKFLAGQPSVDSSRIGVIGFCMGGGFALLYAVRAPMNVCATFYGDVPKTADKIRGVCPVLGGYGADDKLFASQGRRLDTLLAENAVEHDVKLYDGAGHSFMSRHEGALAKLAAYGPMRVGYNHAAAEDSWKRIDAFFARHLGR
ncbi:MAG TPA: dienelactone hydrolase family protein [Candidatus Binataceae bacterium]|nr:dienelactone hydrolase family protein [Candidatus Binataceae bacterium]